MNPLMKPIIRCPGGSIAAGDLAFNRVSSDQHLFWSAQRSQGAQNISKAHVFMQLLEGTLA